jgi:hypothetical protein
MQNDNSLYLRIEELTHKINILEAKSSIENLMGSYQYYYTAGNTKAITEGIWAQNNDNVSLEWGASGVFRGLKKVSTFYEKDIIDGKLSLYTLNTAVIEVEKDNKSAKAIWTVIGTETDAGELGLNKPKTLEDKALLSSSTEDNLSYRAEWVWQKYEVDFIVENNEWRILHLHIHDIFRCPFDRDWVQYSKERFKTDGLLIDSMFKSNLPFDPNGPPENNANEESTFHWQYKVDSSPQQRPFPPIKKKKVKE